MPIIAMDDGHLVNTIAYLKRVINERVTREYYAQAQERDVTRLMEARQAMIKEARIRGINPYGPVHRKIRPYIGRYRIRLLKPPS